MAEVNINAKIEEALLKIKPAKQTNQFGIWADDVDDFIIATIKTNPEIDLSFVDKLSTVVIKTKVGPQQSGSLCVSGENNRSAKAVAQGFKKQDRVQIFIGSETGESEYGKIDDAMTFFESTNSKTEKKADKDLSKKQVLFHELNHAISANEYYKNESSNSQNKNETLGFMVGDEVDLKTLDWSEDSNEMMEFLGGFPVRVCKIFDGEMRIWPLPFEEKWLNEGQTENLANKKMKVLYPDFQENIETPYLVFSKLTELGDLMFDDVFTKAYYNGVKEFEAKQQDEMFVKYLKTCSKLCADYNQYLIEARTQQNQEEAKIRSGLDLLEDMMVLSDIAVFCNLEMWENKSTQELLRREKIVRGLSDITESCFLCSLLYTNSGRAEQEAVIAHLFDQKIKSFRGRKNAEYGMQENWREHIKTEKQRILNGKTEYLTEKDRDDLVKKVDDMTALLKSKKAEENTKKETTSTLNNAEKAM